MTAQATEKDVVGEEHWTKKGDDVKLFLWEKYVGAPSKGPGDKKGTVLFVHGSSMASTPTFDLRSEEHTSELQSLMRISYAVFCLKKKKHIQQPYEVTT